VADPYRTACEQPTWVVELQFPLGIGPYKTILCGTLVRARDEVEAIEKAARGRTDYEVIKVRNVTSPNESEEG
jgi:hypothetical protein